LSLKKYNPISSYRYYSALWLHSNKSVLSALVMYIFCTKNVQNGTVKLIFLTKNLWRLNFYPVIHYIDHWTASVYNIIALKLILNLTGQY